MGKLISLYSIVVVFLLGGCSLVEEVNNSLNYTNEATEYINELNAFSQEVPQMIEEAVSNPNLTEELENHLVSLQEDIAEFNKLEAPSIAGNIHQQLVNKNEALQEKIDYVIVNGEVAIERLENTGLITAIEEVMQLRNQIEQLGEN